MYVRRLSLTDFRNYRRLDIELPAGALLFIGDNAQGKTNLLEAVYLLSTIRSPRAGSDGELINWEAAPDGPPVARLVADVERHSEPLRVEMAIQGQPDRDVASSPGQYRAGKRLRVNGVARRAFDAIGQINAVLFTPQDLDLVGGPPSLRRRYMDVTLSQVDRRYFASLQRYSKVLQQRNALLRRLREGAAHADELPFWDGRLAESGAYIVGARARSVAQLAELAAEAQTALSGERETLTLVYEPHWARDLDAQKAASADEADLAHAFVETLLRSRQRELAAGASLWGPHRDDLLFLLDGRSAAAFASRAQRRTAALAVRVAEARFLLAATGEYPVLLLDDVLSEMDERRRRGVLDAIVGFDQVWVTSAEREQEGHKLLPGARVYLVSRGQVSPV